MCGRYAASRAAEELAGLFGVEKWDPAEAPAPDWNVAPTKQVHAVLERPLKDSDDKRPVRQLRPLRWGLVPSWAKSPDVGVKMINARAETVHEKPSYRRPFAARRCLLPDDHPQAWWATCAVITTEAQTEPFAGGGAGGGPRTLADIHPRMPLVLTPDRWDAWLDPSLTDAGRVRELLVPPPAGAMRAYPVGSEVSNVRNNGPGLLTELDGPEAGTLF